MRRTSSENKKKINANKYRITFWGLLCVLCSLHTPSPLVSLQVCILQLCDTFESRMIIIIICVEYSSIEPMSMPMVTHEFGLWRNLEKIFFFVWGRMCIHIFIWAKHWILFFSSAMPSTTTIFIYNFTTNEMGYFLWRIFSLLTPATCAGRTNTPPSTAPSYSSVVFIHFVCECIFRWSRRSPFSPYVMVVHCTFKYTYECAMHAVGLSFLCTHFLYCNHVDFHRVIFCKYVHIEHCIVYFVSFYLTRFGSVWPSLHNVAHSRCHRKRLYASYITCRYILLVVFALRSHALSTRLRRIFKPSEFASYRQCHRHREGKGEANAHIFTHKLSVYMLVVGFAFFIVVSFFHKFPIFSSSIRIARSRIAMRWLFQSLSFVSAIACASDYLPLFKQ